MTGLEPAALAGGNTGERQIRRWERIAGLASIEGEE